MYAHSSAQCLVHEVILNIHQKHGLLSYNELHSNHINLRRELPILYIYISLLKNHIAANRHVWPLPSANGLELGSIKSPVSSIYIYIDINHHAAVDINIHASAGHLQPWNLAQMSCTSCIPTDPDHVDVLAATICSSVSPASVFLPANRIN